MGLNQVTQKDGQRCSTYRAYLAPALKRPNLQVLTGAAAQRVLFDGRRAVGVQVLQGGRLLSVKARAEVILSAGAFQSPQLLMVSGVGDPSDLAPQGVAVHHPLSGVGRNLHDHIDFVFGWRMRGTDLLGVSLPGTWRLLQEIRRWRHHRRGQLATNFAEMGGFPRPILHGLCTYGFTGRALLHTLCGGDPGRFTKMEGRFSSPVFPGEALTVNLWVDGDQAVFQTCGGDGRVVLDAGLCTFR